MNDYPTDPVSPVTAAQRLGVSKAVIYRWCNKGRIRSWRIGAVLRVSLAEVLAMPRLQPPLPAPRVATPGQRKKERRLTGWVLEANGISRT